MDRSVCMRTKLLRPVDTMEGTQGLPNPLVNNRSGNQGRLWVWPKQTLPPYVPARQQRPDAMASAPAYGPHLLLLRSQIPFHASAWWPLSLGSQVIPEQRLGLKPCVVVVTLELLPKN